MTSCSSRNDNSTTTMIRTKRAGACLEAVAEFLACDMDALTTTEVAAAALGMQPSSLRSLRASGRGPAFVEVRGSAEVRYRKADVVDYRRRVARRLWIAQSLSTDMLIALIAGRVVIDRRSVYEDPTPNAPPRATSMTIELLFDRLAA